MTNGAPVQCEMCGTETSSPNRVKIEGAELDVCDDCTDFGTEVRTEDTGGSTSTKYSTGASGSDTGSSSGGRSSGTTGGSSTGSSSGGGGRRRGEEMFEDIEELAQNYDDRILSARESRGLSQEDLAKTLNEKASLIRKLEHGDTLPSDEVQRKLERELDIDLSAGGPAEDTEWESGESTGEYTLGDVVERKDS